MTPRGKDRTQAIRLAKKAKSARDNERARHESLIEAALADYYEATAKADRIRAAARRKADTIIESAEQNAADSVAAARDAVRRLRELLGGNAEVAQLCGITPAKVREYLTTVSDASAKGSDDTGAPSP